MPMLEGKHTQHISKTKETICCIKQKGVLTLTKHKLRSSIKHVIQYKVHNFRERFQHINKTSKIKKKEQIRKRCFLCLSKVQEVPFFFLLWYYGINLVRNVNPGYSVRQ